MILKTTNSQAGSQCVPGAAVPKRCAHAWGRPRGGGWAARLRSPTSASAGGGKGERGVWGCGAAAGRCPGTAGASSPGGHVSSQEGGRASHSAGFHASRAAGGTSTSAVSGLSFHSEAVLIAPVCAVPSAAATGTVHQTQQHNPFGLMKCSAGRCRAARAVNSGSPRRRERQRTRGWVERQTD